MSLVSLVQRLNPVQRLNLSRFFLGDAPSPAPWVLGRRNVYIMPTRQGVFYAVILLVILVGAINYSNSLGYFLTFLLGGIGNIGILHTYRNLIKLQIRLGPIEPVFAGDQTRIPVILEAAERSSRYQIELTLDGRSSKADEIVPDRHNRIVLYQQTESRGWHSVGRITLATTFPLGLFRAWSHVVPDTRYLVYPAPARDTRLPQTSRYMASLQGDQGMGSDDFAGLRSYRSGDSLKHIHWKALAREQGLLTKQFGGDRSEQMWLDWQMLDGMDVETRLAYMCRWVIEAARQDLEYGLWLPGEVIEPARGSQHQAQCLRALALFG